MWSNPRPLLAALAHSTWGMGLATKNYEISFNIEDRFTDPRAEGIQELKTLFSLITDGLYEGADPMRPPGEYVERVSRGLLRLTRRIERSPGYELLIRMSLVMTVGYGTSMISGEEGAVSVVGREQELAGIWPVTPLGIALYGVLLLLGSERRMLCGLRDGKPAFKELPVPLLSGEQFLELIRQEDFINRFPLLRVIGRDDIDLVPAIHESRSVPQNLPTGSPALIRKLLEDAYYNQRYVVDQHGAFVKTPGHPHFESVLLKVRPALYDKNYIDILARFNTPHGDFCQCMYGELVVNAIYDEGYSEASTYLYCVLAQLYHDLVTAREIRILSGTAEVAPARDLAEPVEHWIYIPRVIKNRERPPRQKLQQPRVMTPHHVRGHRRKANMTDQHREEIERFERETSLQILNWLPQGYTFVRPHVSPANYEVAKLPIFIRRRLQQELITQLGAETILPK